MNGTLPPCCGSLWTTMTKRLEEQVEQVIVKTRKIAKEAKLQNTATKQHGKATHLEGLGTEAI